MNSKDVEEALINLTKVSGETRFLVSADTQAIIVNRTMAALRLHHGLLKIAEAIESKKAL